jgi:hypothetical protein
MFPDPVFVPDKWLSPVRRHLPTILADQGAGRIEAATDVHVKAHAGQAVAKMALR